MNNLLSSALRYDRNNTFRIDYRVSNPTLHHGATKFEGGVLKFGGDCVGFLQQALMQSGYAIPYLNPAGAVNTTTSTLSPEGRKWFTQVAPNDIRPGDIVYFKNHVGIVQSYDPAKSAGTIVSLTGDNNVGWVTHGVQFEINPNSALDYGSKNKQPFYLAARPRPEHYIPELERQGTSADASISQYGLSTLAEAGAQGGSMGGDRSDPSPVQRPLTFQAHAGAGDKAVTLRGVVTDENGVQKSVEVFGSGARLETNLANGAGEWVMPNGNKGHVRYHTTSEGTVEVKVFDASGQLRMHQQADKNGELIYHSVLDSQGFPTVSVDRRYEDITTTSVFAQPPVENNPAAILADAALKAGIDLAGFFEQANSSSDPQYAEVSPEDSEDRSPAIAGQGDNSPSPYITSPSNASGAETPVPPNANLFEAADTALVGGTSTSFPNPQTNTVHGPTASRLAEIGETGQAGTDSSNDATLLSQLNAREQAWRGLLPTLGDDLRVIRGDDGSSQLVDPQGSVLGQLGRDGIGNATLTLKDGQHITVRADGVIDRQDTLNPSSSGQMMDAATAALTESAQQVVTDAQTAAAWTTANSYAQGFQSALSFIQALEQGNELSAAVAGVSMLNAFAKASGVPQTDLPFTPTTTSSLGAVSAAFNLRDALKHHDELGALAAGTNLASQATAVFASTAATKALATNLGYAAGVFGIANSLKNGDEVGAASSSLMLASQLGWINPWGMAAGLAIGIARALSGNQEKPVIHGEAEVIWNPDGSLSVAVTQSERGGGETARAMLQPLFDTLNGYLGRQTDAHGDPSFALIPQRLPKVTFHAQYESHFILRTVDDQGRVVERYYDGAGNRLSLDGSIESTVAEDFLNEAIEQNAIVPTWEADTIRQRMAHGDSEAWKEEVLSAPEDIKAGLMALTVHLPGVPSPSFPLPRGEGGEPGALRARFDLSGDSYLDPVDWAQPYQAFLALDRDGNGVIDNGLELLTFDASPSPHPSPARGEGESVVARLSGSAHNSLQWLDANNDGVLNSSDPAFGVLKLWLDVNSNAHSEDGELATLSQLGITAIDFTQSPPVIVDGEGNTQPLTPKHLLPKGEGARLASDAGGTEIELQDGYKAMYLRAGDQRIQSAAPSLTVQQELARHTFNMSREAQGLFGGNAALLTGLAVAQTAAAGQAPASPLTLAEVEHAINAAQSARTLGSDTRSLHGLNATPTPTLSHDGGGSVSSAPTLPSPSFPLPEGEGGEPRLAWRAPDNLEGTPDHPLDTGTTTSAPAFTNPLTTGEIIAGSEDTALILTPDALLANDFSRNSNATLRISAVGNATRGSVALLDTGEVVFTPEPNYFGPASFTYTVTDQWGYASQALATVNLASVNDAPVVDVLSDPLGYLSDTYRHRVRRIPRKDHEDFHNFSQQQGTLAATDPDGPGPIAYTIQPGDGPARGYAGIDAAGNWTYRSINGVGHGEAGQVGTFAEAFTVTVADGAGAETRARIDTTYYYNYSEDTDRGFLPVTLDLNGNGLDFSGIDDSNVYFDVNGDGWREHIAWTGANDGLLALDLGNDGIISRPEEIGFARYVPDAKSDLEGLMAFDTNNDGLLSRLDARFNDFAVWQDQNLNGLSEDGEVSTLTERGIESISLTSDRIPQTLAGGDVQLFGTGTYTTTDGQTHQLGDAAFRYTNESIPPPTPTLPRPSPSFPLPQAGEGSEPGASHNFVYPGGGGETNAVLVTEAEIMRMALVFTEMSAAFGAGTTNEPLGSVETAVTDSAIVTYDDPTGLVPGKT